MEKALERMQIVAAGFMMLTSAIIFGGAVMLFIEIKGLVDKVFPG